MDNVKIINIEKTYLSNKNSSKKSFNLNIPRLEINEGEFFGLLGPSGCGKSTMLKLIAGLLELNSGEIYIGEENIVSTPTEKRNLAMVFQESLLFPHMTLEENVGFGLKMRKISREHRKIKVKEILNIVNLEGMEKRYPDQLSGGQKQRGAIARALVCSPKLLLMDEPFSALDPKLREDMREFTKSLHSKHKITTIFVTHDKEEAFFLFDKMAIMNQGKIIQVGSPKDLYENPESSFVAEFLGIKNIFYGDIKNNVFYGKDFILNLVEVKLKIEKGYESNTCFKNDNMDYKGKYLAIKPEGCFVCKSWPEDPLLKKDYGCIKGEIKSMSYMQGFLRLSVKISKGYSIDVLQSYNSDVTFFIGEKVIVGYNFNKINIIN
ncbi:ABC transporter ATP-binding protein [Clostridium algidicarnis]|uniref:ABC transporter ATP-binding protein n=1 Tax=Clostridium algidicarnis TaxID=37659 RepID=UPI001C0ABBD3|nr:ABC transporter ATP-binding protein [Clostridium algidicarnis]MBU3195720.1 ABC transporter ATP-binding protein [Clostridium algidicarnis]MBU3208742.1 ABC transporter ATP-binding protein [Clostridium algidicarnis]MBU3226747.1 ABC transporter ATP-binding protein [Clostridium algidicarnis]MBU3250342.1 ABC transporter ATP-binding protein [Clostridium algidicarnis]